jgi:predicted RNA-binding protein with PUA-like domain
MPKGDRAWLFKSEPESFSLDDLRTAPGQSTCWDGVRNYQARNLLRDEVERDQKVLFYHSSTKQPAVVGVCVVTREAYPDPTQFDRKSPYYDAGSPVDAPRWLCVDVRFESAFARRVTLGMLREEPTLAKMPLLQRGNRLSVMPVTAAEFETIVGLGRV